VFAQDLPKLDALVADGLVTLDVGGVRVTEAGRPFVRLAAQAFDHRSDAKEGFSRAI